MFKVTPNPPDTDPASPYEPDSKKLNEAAERALNFHFHFPSHADIKATARKPSKLFALLGISNSIMVAEITAIRVLDHIEPPV